MIRFRIKPDDDGEPGWDVTATARDILQWERSGQRTYGQLVDNQRMADMYRIAYIASRRQGLFEGSYDAFEKGYDLDQLSDRDGGGDGDTDPTQPAQ